VLRDSQLRAALIASGHRRAAAFDREVTGARLVAALMPVLT
jgi:hypothetical protein